MANRVHRGDRRVVFVYTCVTVLGTLACAVLGITAGVALNPARAAALSGEGRLGTAELPPPPGFEIHALMVATSVIMLLIILGSVLFMYVVHRRFFQACVEKDQLALYARSPGGLPEGTIRSMLAFVIVAASLCFLALVVWGDETKAKFPELLSGILGSVLGFYFGSRSSGREPNEALAEEFGELRVERDRAVEAKDKAVIAREETLEQTQTQDAHSWRAKVQKGIDLTRIIVELLPKEVGQRYVELADRLTKGLAAIDVLIAQPGGAAQAVAKASELFAEFRTRNPMFEIANRAVGSFAPILATALPGVAPFAFITTLIAAGIRLGGARYQAWKARILHLPFSPAVVPLQLVDANTGFSLIQQSPIFRKSFEAELLNNDRPFLKSLIDEFLGQPDADALWERHKRRFESRQQFDEGLSELRRAAADSELEQDIALVAPEFLKDVGGYRAAVAAVDKIHEDPQALADLDALMLAAEGLHRNNEPVLNILEKVKVEIGESERRLMP